MSWFGIIIIGVLLFFIAQQVWQRSNLRQRKLVIDNYSFPRTLQVRLQERYPHLQKQDIDDILQGLKVYFHLCNKAGKRRMVSMPSQAVDVAWHEFILFTRQYQQFCQQALGRFLHHVPAEAMKTPTQAQDGIKVAWRLSCQRERIDPLKPTQLPLLFLLDMRLGIPDGFQYSLNCMGNQRGEYCASHIGCGGSGCGGGGDSSDAGGDSGCGGGCGGGGD